MFLFSDVTCIIFQLISRNSGSIYISIDFIEPDLHIFVILIFLFFRFHSQGFFQNLSHLFITFQSLKSGKMRHIFKSRMIRPFLKSTLYLQTGAEFYTPY